MVNKTIDLNDIIIRDYVESIRPEDESIRKQLDYGYSYDGKIAIIYEVRPLWDDPSVYENYGLAKIRHYKTRKEWHLYWMRASGKWESYKPFPSSSDLKEVIQAIEEDAYACFFG